MQTTTQEPEKPLIPNYKPSYAEEVIACHLKDQTRRFPKGSQPHLIVFTQPDGSVRSMACSWNNVDPDSIGDESLDMAVTKYLDALEGHNPLSIKRAEVERLQKEITELEQSTPNHQTPEAN